MEPILLRPALKDNLWGGTKLKTKYGKQTDMEIVAESWELSTHKDGQSTVASGPDAGMVLSDYIEKYGKQILGTNAQRFDYFPILIKFIDAKDNLSIQVHPDDTYALANEGEYGKTEMWYILEAEPDAYLYYGLNTTMDQATFREKIQDNTVMDILNRVPVHKGDVFFIPAGTIHAIGAGIVICEIQQNSNTTYRVYDYDRRDAQGNPRDLHVEQALAVADLCPPGDASGRQAPRVLDGAQQETLATCSYFTVEKLDITHSYQGSVTQDTFQSLVVAEGSGTLNFGDFVLEFKKGDSIFIPAQVADYTIFGNCELVLSYV